MPLMHGKSKKAFSKNVKTEMEAGKPQKQALAIAYSVKRKPKKMAGGGTTRPDGGFGTVTVYEAGGGKIKKMADGGPVSAKTEKRPMPETKANDAHEIARNAAKHALVQDGWTDQPTLPQARKGMKTTPIKHPSMAQSPIIKAKLRDEEDHLETSAGVNNGPQEQPPHDDDELGPDRSGPKVPDMQREHNNGRKPYAKGGMTRKDHGIEEKERHEEADMEESLGPSEDEGDEMAMSDDELDQKRNGNRVPDMEDEHSTHRAPYAGGGEIGDDEANMDHEEEMNPAHSHYSADDSESAPMDEEMEEHHASITAAIMAKRAKLHEMVASGAMDEDHAAEDMMAEGGEVDLDENAMEEPNGYYPRNEHAALKENYDEDMHDVTEPMDSNEHGDEEESHSENKHDMVSAIRSKMAKKRR